MELNGVDGDRLLVGRLWRATPAVEGEFSLRVEESDLPSIGACGQDIAHLKAGPSQAVEVEVLLVVLILEPEVPSP